MGPAAGRMGRFRVRAVVVLLGVVATVPAWVGLARVAEAQTVPDPNLTSYVLFGVEELDFKGGQGNHGPSIIDGGNIGVGTSGFIRGNDYRMNICANAQMIMSDDTMVVSDTLRMGDARTPAQECDVHEVFNNTGAANNELSRTGPALSFLPPPVTSAPTFPTFACDPANDVTVPANAPATTLAPGTYGDVNFQNGTVVALTTGVYTFCRFTSGQNVTVTTEPGVVIESVGDFLIRDNMSFDGEDCATIPSVFVAATGLGANDNAVTMGQDSDVWGHFYSPTGRINLGNQTTLHGTFWGQAIGSDFNVDIEYCPPTVEPPELPTGSISVTKVLSGDLAGTPPSDATYDIRLDCDIPSRGFREVLDVTLSLVAGETVTYDEIPLGTTCTVVEVSGPDPPPGYVFDAPIVTPESITVDAAGQTFAIVVENPLREIFGSLQVTKTVSGSSAGYIPGSVFGFGLDCAGEEFDTTFELVAGETFTSDPIRVGTECSVTETSVPAPVDGYLYTDPVFTPDPPTVTIAEEEQVVQIDVVNGLVAPEEPTGPIEPPAQPGGSVQPPAQPLPPTDLADTGGPQRRAAVGGLILVFAGGAMLVGARPRRRPGTDAETRG